MIQSKNKLMLWMAAGIVLLSGLVHVLQRVYHVFVGHHVSMHGEQASASPLALNVFLAAPIVLLIAGLYLYVARGKDHPWIPACLVLALTMGSMSIIAGGGGGVEFHFSIFMVVAFVAYYENTRLVLLMTALFAIQHLAGFFWFPELVFGVKSYSFLMLAVHAIFLLLTSGATTLQIISKRRITGVLEQQKEAKQHEAAQLLARVQTLSDQLGQSSVTVSERSRQTIGMNAEMSRSFHEVASGIGAQTTSIMNIEGSLQRIHERISSTADASQAIIGLANQTSLSIRSSEQGMGALAEQIGAAREEMRSVEGQISTLHDAIRQVERILVTVREVADQTNLIALNAAIEAARAGEQGKSFGVVASEIRKLAERSHEATEAVQTILSSIEQASNASVERSAASRQVIEQAVTRTTEAVEDFRQMSQDLAAMLQSVQELGSSIAQIDEASLHISEEAGQITGVTQEGAAAVEQLVQLSEAQMHAYEEVNTEIVRLHELSASLHEQFGPSGSDAR
ncbi:hypothetical protein PA598K_01828 [Paenibacillus sp. 598K]|uniref:methyl-accepting chemotaxis protein n=1 Tax=Paenibacillus sp. 598K TaxID=1117987 RepID=UPI000FFA21C7|nr:methyl-accepting chemotaxis protein [Paenibacillus sp. 598K]GBF73532.1 hypothetical protein PA598K_01828 [Paenibacillus sp. 598K]